MGYKNYATPIDFFNHCDKKFGPYVLDAAAWGYNAKCPNYMTPNDNALKTDWLKFLQKKGNIPPKKRKVWLNPPYQNLIIWVTRAINQSERNDLDVTMLLPNDTDTKWFHCLVSWWGVEIFFTKGRLKFLTKEGVAPQPRQGLIVARVATDLDGIRFGTVDVKTGNFQYI